MERNKNNQSISEYRTYTQMMCTLPTCTSHHVIRGNRSLELRNTVGIHTQFTLEIVTGRRQYTQSTTTGLYGRRPTLSLNNWYASKCMYRRVKAFQVQSNAGPPRVFRETYQLPIIPKYFTLYQYDFFHCSAIARKRAKWIEGKLFETLKVIHPLEQEETYGETMQRLIKATKNQSYSVLLKLHIHYIFNKFASINIQIIATTTPQKETNAIWLRQIFNEPLPLDLFELDLIIFKVNNYMKTWKIVWQIKKKSSKQSMSRIQTYSLLVYYTPLFVCIRTKKLNKNIVSKCMFPSESTN